MTDWRKRGPIRPGEPPLTDAEHDELYARPVYLIANEMLFDIRELSK